MNDPHATIPLTMYDEMKEKLKQFDDIAKRLDENLDKVFKLEGFVLELTSGRSHDRIEDMMYKHGVNTGINVQLNKRIVTYQ